MNDSSEKKLPLFAVVPNKGKGRVLEYHGNGYFTVLLPGDVRQYSHRKNLIFTNNPGTGKKKKPKSTPKTQWKKSA